MDAMIDKTTEAGASRDLGHGISFGEAFWVWLRVAVLSFGGPAGQIAVMHRILVEEKNWISESRFLHALNYCMLLPGPEAQQLATYIGWLLHRTAGGIMAGGLFILPGVIAIMGLSYIYAAYGNVGFVEAVFFGLKAAVLAIVVQAVVRVGKRALRNRVMIALAAIAFVAIFFFNVPFPIIIIAAGVIGISARRAAGRNSPPSNTAAAARSRRRSTACSARNCPITCARAWPRAARSAVWLLLWVVPVAALLIGLGQANVFSQIALFFSKMAMVTFGGAYAVLAYVAQQAVEHYHWLQPREMLDGLGMAETTPGPLIMVLQFVGFMAAYRDPGALSPMCGRDARRIAGDLGHLHPLLPLDLPRRALHRDATRQQGAGRRAVGDHRRGGRRDPEPLDLVRVAHAVPADHAGTLARPVVRHAGVGKPRSRGLRAGSCRGDRDLPSQHRDVVGVGGVVRGGSDDAVCGDGVNAAAIS